MIQLIIVIGWVVSLYRFEFASKVHLISMMTLVGFSIMFLMVGLDFIASRTGIWVFYLFIAYVVIQFYRHIKN